MQALKKIDRQYGFVQTVLILYCLKGNMHAGGVAFVACVKFVQILHQFGYTLEL